MSIPVIGADRFPVTVTVPGSGWKMETVRAVITLPSGGEPGRLMVWMFATDEPELDVAWDREASTIGPNSQQWAISTTDGVFTIDSERGCGCSSPLKTHQIFGSYRMGVLR